MIGRSMSEAEIEPVDSPPQIEPFRPQLPRRHRLRRFGCIVLLVVWFAILLLPCFMIALAVQGEIVLTQGDIPGQQIRFWLIMETRNRGIGISSASVIGDAETDVCVQTTVNYVLWQGTENETSVYCECFTRDSSDAGWSLASTNAGVCTQP